MGENIQIETKVNMTNGKPRAKSWREFLETRNMQLVSMKRVKQFDIVVAINDKNQIIVLKGRESENRLWIKSSIGFSSEEYEFVRNAMEKAYNVIMSKEAEQLLNIVKNNPTLLQRLKELLKGVQ